MEKPAAGGGAAGFPIEPNGDWEEECRHSRSRPLGGGVGLLHASKLRGRRYVASISMTIADS